MRLKESINQNQINLLKATYGDIKKINPNSPAVKKLMMALKKLSKDDLETLSKAKINFVSTMAQSILRDSNVSESADIDNLQKRKNDLLKQVDPLIAKKKKLYSDVDITTPKSSDEKKLDKEIADLFSEINDLVHKIVKLKKSQNEGKHTMKLKSVNEADLNWNAVQNAIINFLKVNTKILDKKVQAKDTEGVKGGLKSIISGLTNAQRSLNLESVNEASYTVKAENPYQFVNGAYAVLSAYLRDEELGPKGKRELQSILKSLDYMRKYFFFKLNESVNEEIAVGKMVKVVDNPHWEAALGKKGPFKRKVKMIDGDNVFFTDGSNSSMKYVKESVESVNEAKYPTDLKIGSVILGQGFTMLKGIDGGKYYKVIAMDDVSATLVPSDKNGNVKGSKKVRHKLDSIEGGIKTAKRGDENGIVVIKESAKKSTFIKVARISNNGKLDIY